MKKKPRPLTHHDFPAIIELFPKGSQLRQQVVLHLAEKLIEGPEFPIPPNIIQKAYGPEAVKRV